MVRKKELSPELIAEARRLYEQTLTPVKDIMAMVGLARSNFYYRVRDWGWQQRRRRGKNGSRLPKHKREMLSVAFRSWIRFGNRHRVYILPWKVISRPTRLMPSRHATG